MLRRSLRSNRRHADEASSSIPHQVPAWDVGFYSSMASCSKNASERAARKVQWSRAVLSTTSDEINEVRLVPVEGPVLRAGNK